MAPGKDMGDDNMTTRDTGLNRRRFLQTTAAGAAALAAPAIIPYKVFAQSSGEVNFMGWAGYPALAETVFPAFTAATGIKVNFNEQPDQDAMFAQAKLALQTGGIDVVEPTVDRVGAWASNGLVQGWDMTKLDINAYLPGLADGTMGEMATVDGQRMIVLSVWGTETIVHAADAKMTAPPSLGDLFAADNSACLRPHSALAAMGRHLDATGKLPMPWMDGYKSEENMKVVWDIALAEAIKAKGNVVQWWSGENEAQAGFKVNGATIGLNWDSTGYNLRNDGYVTTTPSEGAFAWNQGFVMMKNAANTDQAHEFAKWVATPDGAAMWATAFSANPVAKGASDKMGAEVAAFYAQAFQGDALSKLWWWPAQDAWFLAKRGEYADQYRAA
jgi:spermidine/putrescine transport system substrate-binding protein